MNSKILKTIVLLFCISSFTSSLDTSAQTPEKIGYQAIVRNSKGELTINQGVGIKISILKESEDGTLMYEETQSPATNANGLITVEIGNGEVVSGSMSSIDWGNGPYFIKTEIDPTSISGTNYIIATTSQILSVPFALHAKTAENIVGGITENDPVFTAWDKSTGISITESQISDIGNYLEVETDPEFTTWDKSNGISISESQISDFGDYVETESDPAFSAWDKSAGISITESQISDFGDYIETESDPVFSASAAFSITDAGSGGVISNEERQKLSGIDQGAQKNVKSDWNAAEGDAEILNKPTNLSDFTNDAGYISLSESPSEGDIVFYDGSSWTKLAKGNPGQVLSINSNGEFTWGSLASVPDATTLESNVLVNGNAKLNASVSANGLATTVTFEYGTTPSLGTSIVADQSPLSGNALFDVSVSISGLTIGETYYFRVKAENALGVVFGEIVSFVSLTVGDSYAGGKVAYIFKEGDPGFVSGEVHGLIASDADLSSGIQWYNGISVATEAIGVSLGDGKKNTGMIIDKQGEGNYAALICSNYTGGGYTDWYLPCTGEIQKLYINRSAIGGFTSSTYWTSTEVDQSNAKGLRSWDGSWWNLSKSFEYLVRAVRLF